MVADLFSSESGGFTSETDTNKLSSTTTIAKGTGHQLRNMSALPYYWAFLPHVLVLTSYYFLGGAWNFFTLAFVFIAIPLIDYLMGKDDYNPTKEEEKILEKKISFRLVTWIWVPAQVAILLWSCYVVSTTGSTMSWSAWLGLVSGIGIIGGLGINCAHELIHKASVFEQTLGQTALAFVCYGHFYVEHLFGHHKKVSTPYDPASSRYGEMVYTFWFRSVYGSILSALHIERARLAKLGVSELSLQNRVVVSTLFSAAIAYTLNLVFGAAALKFFLTQSVIAFSLLEIINYVEHYGLTRKPKTDKEKEKEKENENEKEPTVNAGEEKEYERVTPAHSWNAADRVTNYFLFKLQRHSDHHAYAGRRYQVLRSWKSSPQLPFGYATMILIALVPPLWFHIMNWRVDAIRAKVAEWESKNINPFVDPSKSD